jgi:twitching motility protein PilT
MEAFSLSMDAILTEAVRRQASDTHITVGLPAMIRVHGDLMPMNSNILTQSDAEFLCKSMLDKSRLQYLNERGEIDFSYVVKDYSRFRCNIYKQRGSYTLAARTITTEIPTCERLGLPELFKELALRPRGLILVTGPTGSGKSTTLAAMVGHINQTRRCHILTLEEPIEYLHRHGESMINQREVHEDTLSFANALRAALREDPDVIMVGEMRDLDTIATAITASETGHLVMSTLHTSSAGDTINRIIDVFPPHQQDQIRVQLGAVLVAVISQTLIPRADGTGRIAAFEILLANDAVRNLIREGKTHQIDNTISTNIKSGMCSLDYYLAELVKKNLVTREVALSRCRSAEEFRRFLSNAGSANVGGSGLFDSLEY